MQIICMSTGVSYRGGLGFFVPDEAALPIWFACEKCFAPARRVNSVPLPHDFLSGQVMFPAQVTCCSPEDDTGQSLHPVACITGVAVVVAPASHQSVDVDKHV